MNYLLFIIGVLVMKVLKQCSYNRSFFTGLLLYRV